MRPIPLRPDAGALTARNVAAVTRAVVAKAKGKLDGRSEADAVLRERWPDDPIAPLVLRASAEPPAMLPNAALGRSIVADIIATIGPVGAGARLLQAGLSLVFDRMALIYVPSLQATASAGSFVQEGQPVPVHDLVSGSVPLVPRKLGTIVALTAEMLESSNAEALVTDALTRSVGLALDAALFDTAPADQVRPAGLRHGIAALPASTSTDAHTAMVNDMVAVAGAVSVIGSPIVFVASLARAVAMSLMAYSEPPFAIYGSPALAANDLIAIATKGLASAVDSIPEIDTTKTGTLHMEDSTPAPIASPGSPPAIAAPARSLWQTASLGIKLRFSVDWVLRDPRALAWTTVSGW